MFGLVTEVRALARRTGSAFFPWHEIDQAWRRGLSVFLVDGLFIALSAAFVGTFIPLFALGMGATGAQVGLLTSLAGAASIAGNALGGPVVRRLNTAASPDGGRKRAALYFGRIEDTASMVLVIAIPFFFGGPAAVQALLIVQTIRSFLGSIGTPAWAAFVPMIVPLRIRGRYMSLRSMIQVGCSVVAVPAAGFIITGLHGYPTGYQASFLISMALGLTAAFFFSRIPLPHANDEEQRVPADSNAAGKVTVHTGRREWRSPFGRFMLGAFVWTVSSAVAGPFYVVFMTQGLGLKARDIGLLASFATAAQLVGYALLGRYVDRRGSRLVVVLSALGLAIVPLGWLLVKNWWAILPLHVLAGVATAGYGLASFNLLLEVTPENGRASYTGAYYTLLAVAATIAPLVGSWLFRLHGFPSTLAVTGIASLFAAALFGVLFWGGPAWRTRLRGGDSLGAAVP